MKNQASTHVFDRERAVAYDQEMAKFAQFYESLYFLIRVVLADLPANAHLVRQANLFTNLKAIGE